MARREEVNSQLRRAHAVFLVLDYNSLDASVKWGKEQLAWRELGDRLHVVVNKLEDTSLKREGENKQEALRRVRLCLAATSCSLAAPTNQV